LSDEKFPDLDDALEAADSRPHVFFIDRRAPENFENGIKLSQNLFEPKLVRLMDDNEKHLVVSRLTKLITSLFLEL
jgi:hypothetical protein